MKFEDRKKVEDYLSSVGIKYVSVDQTNVILVDRDSILKWEDGHGEEAAYSALIDHLNAMFSCRFAYNAKTDEWLMLDKIA